VDVIPLVDLRAQLEECLGEIEQRWHQEVFEPTQFIGGPPVERFEREYAEYVGVQYCVAVGSGTDALELALRVAEIDHGREVILPVNTFAATAMAVLRAGATPVYVDCDPEYLLIDPAGLEAAITERTAAVIPVHLHGQMAPMAPVQAVAKRHNLHVIEDAAQSQGAGQEGYRPDNPDLLAATSFYPGKNLGAMGDAGAVLTNAWGLADDLRALRNYGSTQKYHHPMVGFNSRLDPIQAVVLSVKLARLESWNRQRQLAAAEYDRLLRNLPAVRLPRTASGNQPVWHIYAIRVPAAIRDQVLDRLQAGGIQAGIHYPKPLHWEGFAMGYQVSRPLGVFPHAEAAAAEMISLPLYPHITYAQQERVTENLAKALAEVG
jgi:dTDP-4-amino-4,6-dideoxygalactose transaminase